MTTHGQTETTEAFERLAAAYGKRTRKEGRAGKATVAILAFGRRFHTLGYIFVALKLAQIGLPAAWSWWLVTLPFWFGYGIIAAWLLVLCAVLIVGVSLGLAWRFGKWLLSRFKSVD